MKRLLREPLLHFLALSGLIVVADRALSPSGDQTSRAITVTTERIENLASLFNRTWQRPPTSKELQGLIDDYVREEVLYREGVALGLDRDDDVIRRRIGQKMEFLAQDASALRAPTDAELQQYLDSHAADFTVEARVSFRQIYFNPERRGAALEADVAQALQELRQQAKGTERDDMGDPTMLPRAMTDAPIRDVRALFGEALPAAVSTQTVGAWQGPVRSSYGLHLVLVTQRVDAQTPQLGEGRAAVEREWALDHQQADLEALYQRLAQRYTIMIEPPAGDVARQ